MRVLLGRDCRTFLIWTARSVRLSIAENENEPPWDYSHSQIHKHTNRQKEVTLTDTGYEVMEDFFREEGVIQASKVKLEHTSNWVHVMVILVPCERVLTYTGWEEEGPWDTTDNNALDKHNRGEMLVFPCRTVLPLSKAFLMSLTSTCEPDTLKIPSCCRPTHVHNHTQVNINSLVQFQRFTNLKLEGRILIHFFQFKEIQNQSHL